MSKVIVYTINDEREAVDMFECEREFAMESYFNKRNSKGRYVIANVGERINYPIKRKSRKDIRYRSKLSEEQ